MKRLLLVGLLMFFGCKEEPLPPGPTTALMGTGMELGDRVYYRQRWYKVKKMSDNIVVVGVKGRGSVSEYYRAISSCGESSSREVPYLGRPRWYWR
jgi:hypothetical protein